MPNQFWIQVRPDGAIVSKQRTSGRRKPSNPPNRMIQVDEDFFQRVFRNPDNPKGDYIPLLEYTIDERDVKQEDRNKDDVVVKERKITTRQRVERT